jgi:Flp pilus assembly protein TadG
MKKYFLLMAAFIAVIVNAQVGINTVNPNANTALEIVSQNNNQGIMIPRMTEAERNAISVNNVNDNSLMVYNTDEDCYNYYSKTDGEWKSLCGGVAKAVFSPSTDCSLYAIHGVYIRGKALDNSNYLSVTVNVAKAGAYNIIVDAFYSPGVSNGYGFATSGTFLNPGTYTINIPAQGTPINIHSTTGNPAVGDSLRFLFQGVDRTTEINCPLLVVPVLDDVATYALNCSSITVDGAYIKDTAMKASNTITMTVTVSTTGSYYITGTTDAGITFTGNGNFSTIGTHPVTLYGGGTPTVNTNIPVTIKSNSMSGNTTCTALAPITLPAMTYGIIGYGDYSWNSVRRNAFNSSAFGPSGIVKIQSFTQKWTASSASDGLTAINGNPKPDIVLYFSYGAAPTQQLSTALASYVRAGGVLIFGTYDYQDSEANYLLNGIFGAGAGTAIDQTSASDDNDYLIINNPNDPIINGPFGNLAGRYWGEDNLGSVIVTRLPPNSVQVCAANNLYTNASVNPDYSIIWYNDNLNFFYFGDSTGAITGASDNRNYPSRYGTVSSGVGGLPISKSYGRYASGSDYPYVYNSALELNAVAWGIKKAAISGINPH